MILNFVYVIILPTEFSEFCVIQCVNLYLYSPSSEIVCILRKVFFIPREEKYIRLEYVQIHRFIKNTFISNPPRIYFGK